MLKLALAILWEYWSSLAMINGVSDIIAVYNLSSVEDNRKLYAEWAADYGKNFDVKMDYILPSFVARYFLENSGKGPVLDVGAGTGLLGTFV